MPANTSRETSKDSTAVLWVSLVTITLLTIGGIVVVNHSPPAPVHDDQARLDAALALIDQGEAAFKAWSRARDAGQPSQAHHAEALRCLQQGVEDLQAVLHQPFYLDASGEFLKPEYEGYEAELSQAALLIIDLEKSTQLR